MGSHHNSNFLFYFLSYCIGLIEYYNYSRIVCRIEKHIEQCIKSGTDSPAREYVDKAIGAIWTKNMLPEEEVDNVEKIIQDRFSSTRKTVEFF